MWDNYAYYSDLFLGLDSYVELKNGKSVIPINFDNGATAGGDFGPPAMRPRKGWHGRVMPGGLGHAAAVFERLRRRSCRARSAGWKKAVRQLTGTAEMAQVTEPRRKARARDRQRNPGMRSGCSERRLGQRAYEETPARRGGRPERPLAADRRE